MNSIFGGESTYFNKQTVPAIANI